MIDRSNFNRSLTRSSMICTISVMMNEPRRLPFEMAPSSAGLLGGPTLTDEAERRIRQDILSIVLEPGTRLRLDSLRGRYQVGASPLREALSRLVGEGLVEVEGNKGFRVTPLSGADLVDIAYMRATIEGQAVRDAIARGDAAWEGNIVAALHRLVRATETTATDPTSLATWNAEHDAFHRALIHACGSHRALDAQRRLAEQHARYRIVLMGANMPRQLLVDEHRAMAEAVLARDADLAQRLLGQHMRITSDFYARQLCGAASPSD
ncbi:GntR family transcriptional regulator [Roseomonas sp. KE2513]|uniref:GntR family transcriptional regulator n=1 Tax=Roseomonas sp. KE2513 TaxID=2479202 RepID=UPI0018DF2364|nr:FCD domain-containing protein [Roseomonas sp. KE2513]